MTEKVGYRIFRLIGVWDLILTLPFALPFLNKEIINLLKTVHDILSPQRQFSEFTDLNIFFVQLFGILAVLWAIVRIHKPERFLAMYDTFGRGIVALSMLTFTLKGGSIIPLLFSTSEIGFGILQAVALIKTKKVKKSMNHT